jgi:dTMP kinase
VSAPEAGRLIALEGVDGSGKTTQARRLAQTIGAVLTFEPGGTALGKLLRAMVLDRESPGALPRAEALLMAADRAQHVAEVIRPALEAGEWVVTDRFSGSTLAYQGFGRGLEVAELRGVVEFAAGGLSPDLTVLVDLPIDVARGRLARAAPDRLEGLDPAFFSRVRDGYLRLAADTPTHWVVVDGDAPPDAVAAFVFGEVGRRLGWSPSRAAGRTPPP